MPPGIVSDLSASAGSRKPRAESNSSVPDSNHLTRQPYHTFQLANSDKEHSNRFTPPSHQHRELQYGLTSSFPPQTVLGRHYHRQPSITVNGQLVYYPDDPAEPEFAPPLGDDNSYAQSDHISSYSYSLPALDSSNSFTNSCTSTRVSSMIEAGTPQTLHSYQKCSNLHGHSRVNAPSELGSDNCEEADYNVEDEFPSNCVPEKLDALLKDLKQEHYLLPTIHGKRELSNSSFYDNDVDSANHSTLTATRSNFGPEGERQAPLKSLEISIPREDELGNEVSFVYTDFLQQIDGYFPENPKIIPWPNTLSVERRQEESTLQRLQVCARCTMQKVACEHVLPRINFNADFAQTLTAVPEAALTLQSSTADSDSHMGEQFNCADDVQQLVEPFLDGDSVPDGMPNILGQPQEMTQRTQDSKDDVDHPSKTEISVNVVTGDVKAFNDADTYEKIAPLEEILKRRLMMHNPLKGNAYLGDVQEFSRPEQMSLIGRAESHIQVDLMDDPSEDDHSRDNPNHSINEGKSREDYEESCKDISDCGYLSISGRADISRSPWLEPYENSSLEDHIIRETTSIKHHLTNLLLLKLSRKQHTEVGDASERIQCADSSDTPSNPCTEQQQGASLESSKSLDGKGKRRAADEEISADDPLMIQKAKRRKKNTDIGDRLPCPYYKHDPISFGPLTSRKYGACSGSGFPDISRLKEHLIRVHFTPFQCPRCLYTSRNLAEFYEHTVQLSGCFSRPRELVDGFDANVYVLLVKKKAAASSEDQVNRWNEIYQLVIPKGLLANQSEFDHEPDPGSFRYSMEATGGYEGLPGTFRDEIYNRVDIDVEEIMALGDSLQTDLVSSGQFSWPDTGNEFVVPVNLTDRAPSGTPGRMTASQEQPRTEGERNTMEQRPLMAGGRPVERITWSMPNNTVTQTSSDTEQSRIQNSPPELWNVSVSFEGSTADSGYSTISNTNALFPPGRSFGRSQSTTQDQKAAAELKSYMRELVSELKGDLVGQLKEDFVGQIKGELLGELRREFRREIAE